jgi:DNA-binding NarL/FixJ family response regulator
MSKRSGGGAIRIAVAATSAVRRVGLESIVRGHPEFQLAGSFGAVASLMSFARGTELDVIVIDSDSIRSTLLEPTSRAAIVLLTEVSDARSISRLLRSGVRAILPRESDPEEVLSAIYAAYDGLVLLRQRPQRLWPPFMAITRWSLKLNCQKRSPPAKPMCLECWRRDLSTKISRRVSVSPSIQSSSTSVRFLTSWAPPLEPKRLHWESGAG